MSRKAEIKHWVKEMVIITVTLAAFALTINGLRPDGLPVLSPRRSLEEVKQSGSPVQPISIDEAFEKYRNGSVLFIDARAPEDYFEGHIKGAINLPDHQFDEFFERVIGKLEQFEDFVTYCDGETCSLSGALADKLHKLGFQKVTYMLDGWTRWREKGLPTEISN